jgi:hypothetical protein
MRAFWCLAVVLAVAGCAAGGSNAPARQSGASSAAAAGQRVKAADGFEGEIIGRPAPGSKFSRVTIGMPIREVEDLIGQPNDVAGHITGKAFIPFYFGGDTSMTEAFYKGEGQLSYVPANFGSSAMRLERIIVDPNEAGYAH